MKRQRLPGTIELRNMTSKEFNRMILNQPDPPSGELAKFISEVRSLLPEETFNQQRHLLQTVNPSHYEWFKQIILLGQGYSIPQVCNAVLHIQQEINLSQGLFTFEDFYHVMRTHSIGDAIVKLGLI